MVYLLKSMKKSIFKYLALELDGLGASQDDIFQAMMDYQELVDSIDDEMMKVKLNSCVLFFYYKDVPFSVFQKTNQVWSQRFEVNH